MTRTPEYRFLTILLLTTTGLLGLLFAAAILVDPYGIFGTRLVEPLVLTNRTQKIAALSAMAEKPEVIILGSSRVFEMDPEQVAKKTGLRTYNAGVSYARPEEWVSLTRLMVERLDITPRLLVIGVSVTELNNDAVDSQTITNPDLRPYLPISRRDVIVAGATALKEHFNPRMVGDIARALFFRLRGEPPEGTTFLPNGMQDMRSRTVEGTDRISASIPLAQSLFAGVEHLSPARVQYVRDLAAYGTTHHIPMVVIVLPLAQAADAALLNTQHTRMHQELLHVLEDIKKTHPTFRVVDATVLPRTNDLDDFNDATHPSGAFLRRMIDAAFADE